MCETVCMCVSLYAFCFASMSLFLIDCVCVCVWLAASDNVTFKRNLLQSKITAIKSNLSGSVTFLHINYTSAFRLFQTHRLTQPVF